MGGCGEVRSSSSGGARSGGEPRERGVEPAVPARLASFARCHPRPDRVLDGRRGGGRVRHPRRRQSGVLGRVRDCALVQRRGGQAPAGSRCPGDPGSRVRGDRSAPARRHEPARGALLQLRADDLLVARRRVRARPHDSQRPRRGHIRSAGRPPGSPAGGDRHWPRSLGLTSGGRGRFPAAHRLTRANAVPEALAAISLASGRSVVAWTASTSQTASSGARTIFISQGSSTRAPRGVRSAITVRAGHRIDELALAQGSSVPTVAWIESWFDGAGLYHSRAMTADLGRIVRSRALSPSDELASSLTFAADAQGDQALSWKACTTTGACELHASLRPAHHRFTPPQQLGPWTHHRLPPR